MGAKNIVMTKPMPAAAAVCTNKAEAVVLSAACDIHFCSDCIEMYLLTVWPIQSKRLVAVLRSNSLASRELPDTPPTFSTVTAARRLWRVLSTREGAAAKLTAAKVIRRTAKKLVAIRIMSVGPQTSTEWSIRPGGIGMPAALSRSVNLGTIPVERNRPFTLPFSAMPSFSKTKMSCMLITSL